MFDARAGITPVVFCSSGASRSDKKAVIRLKHAILALAVPAFGLQVGTVGRALSDWPQPIAGDKTESSITMARTKASEIFLALIEVTPASVATASPIEPAMGSILFD